ncbi:hypothetical protein H6G17_29895 [Chroococcidiopsis sp. FACHB-1243]|uniref:hypothetical protein n=1 Tax=Chroococcidiopsis sp. [FACHB-1243] TaxID=2692781 RepID=UPI001783002A|nr:hypothetical protein [Chroococcidiopsis sp. [FACHB-1243]]MBD2309640.1 hypothetical protein [Chroococcidiopsis sp. [FACHB-1243]]
MSLKVIGRIKTGLDDLYAWCELQPLKHEVKSTYAPQRLEKWYRAGSNLRSGDAEKVFRTDEPKRRIVKLGDRLLPGWHSELVCSGDRHSGTSTTISNHRDHTHFQGHAILVNLGEAIYREQLRRNDDSSWQEYKLTDGMVVSINTKLIHSAEQISTERYNLTFRHFKPEYLQLLQH